MYLCVCIYIYTYVYIYITTFSSLLEMSERD